jgi:hypothetical protein
VQGLHYKTKQEIKKQAKPVLSYHFMQLVLLKIQISSLILEGMKQQACPSIMIHLHFPCKQIEHLCVYSAKELQTIHFSTKMV